MRNSHVKAIAAVLSALFILHKVFAATGPGPVGGTDVMLVVDNSGTMKGIAPAAMTTFVDALGGNTRLGVISFGGEAKLVYPLQSVSSDEARKAAGQALAGLRFDDRHTDINAALSLAASELTKSRREGTARSVILVSDGKIDLAPTPGTGTGDESLKELREKLLPAYVRDTIHVYTVAYGKAETALMEDIAAKTDGRSIVAPNSRGLSDALSLVAAAIQPTTEKVESKLQPAQEKKGQSAGPLGSWVPLLVIVTLLVLVLSALAVMMGFANRGLLKRAIAAEPGKGSQKPAPEQRKDRDPVSLGQLGDKLARIASEHEGIARALKDTKLDMEDLIAQSWAGEKGTRDRYHRVVNGLFLIRDKLKDRVRTQQSSEIEQRLLRSTKETLEDDGIEELVPVRGQPFDAMRHKLSSTRSDSLPKGLILDVVREGYYRKGEGGKGEEVLRPAEVVVSDGLAEQQPGVSKRQEEK